ncbi:MAG: 16S rRNA (cytosine(1402)-N(4))-methyltransferase RsmH [Proteobacteria bacterium]|nr:16S rRNA (cytosine(1402)-N(4))-methyltransferase RsmH [Pseudomonadota bacterium]
MSGSFSHIPAMLNEVVAALAPAAGEVYVDGTFGAGGYTKAFLDRADCRVVAIDRDPGAAAQAAALQEKYGKRLRFVPGCFGDAAALVEGPVDGFVLDIGVSSMQIDEAERGFSFRMDGPLDMRMDTSGGVTAADIINTYDEKDLADLIYKYGEERHSRRVARAVVAARKGKKITRTLELAEIVRRAVPRARDGIDPATRTFQALRIAVNRELEELESGLEAAESLLRAGGRLSVVSFHSLEDSIIKKFMNERAGRAGGVSRHMPLPDAPSAGPTFSLPSVKAVTASPAEIAANPRARSAKMRIAIRMGAGGKEAHAS